MSTELTINHFTTLALLLFVIGLSGIFINRKNIISLLMSIELMLLSVNINFVAFSAFLQDLNGQVFSMFVLTVAGAEAAIGLAILIIYFHNRKNAEVNSISSMKG
ncbi:MAG: NADH-quinone oxidoreductase subunit NuoK [Rickettsiales bacterium]|nr:NADH-quinone oxidoreductase subunit NuoK [Rickettsiales bacterium]